MSINREDVNKLMQTVRDLYQVDDIPCHVQSSFHTGCSISTSPTT